MQTETVRLHRSAFVSVRVLKLALMGRISEPAVPTRQPCKARALCSAGSSEICPTELMYRTFDFKFIAQVTEPQVFANAG